MSTFIKPRRFRILFSGFLLISGITSAAVTETQAWQILEKNHSSVSEFPRDKNIPGRKILFLEMPFNQSSWKSKLNFHIDDETIIESVLLVSTRYASNPSFDQKKLDRQRLFLLHQHYPELFKDELTEWKHVQETAANSPSEGRRLFHGFVIIVREKPGKESMAKEIESLKAAFSPVRSFSSDSSLKKKKENSKNETVLAVTRIEASDSLMYFSYSDGIPYLKMTEGYGTTTTAGPLPVYIPFNDSVVSAVLNRNKNWKEMLVVCDITGSMSPYTTQLLAWYKLNTGSGKVNNFVFFNDGDMQSNSNKIIGSTGGIYGTAANGFEPVMNTATKAMRNGFGGDCPENNLEALQYGLTNYGDAKEIIMIADNWATPRDLSLTEKINRPVRIIICGGFMGINPAYLDLARKTGGSVHTMESDLTDLAKLHEDETITIGIFKYKLEGGKFIRVTTL